MKCKNWIQRLLLIVSLGIGIVGTYLWAERLPVCSPAPMTQMAWWGGVYPEYCLPGAMKLVGEEEMEDIETEIPVKVQFKYLTFLNK